MTESNPATIKVSIREDRSALAILAGDWKMGEGLPEFDPVRNELNKESEVSKLSFNTEQLGDWDSGLITFLLKCYDFCEERKIEFQSGSLPVGVAALVRLARSVPERTEARRESNGDSLVDWLGNSAIESQKSVRNALTFIGDCILAFLNLLRGKALFRWSDMALIAQQSGADALPIVALISFLVGMILSFVGAIQLSQFGATIYVADLVAIAMAREMACIMTGIIMCGRTGAAFAAQLGTMKVNEEIDAFKTLGFSPIEFLVLPRMIALSLMMPLLCVFSLFVGILGGLLVLVVMDISFIEYYNQTVRAMNLNHFFMGIAKGAIFGILVAATGCLRGIQCGTSAASVGLATTSAVVTGITLIILADAVFAVLCNVLNI